MDINQLNCFISVAQTLNFSEAARRNYVSQSTVSRYIGELEKEFGVQLFTRSHRDVIITNEGKLLLPYAIDIVNTLSKAKTVIKQMRDGSTGKLTIGCDVTSLSFPSKCIADFNRKYPGIGVELKPLDAADRSQAITGGEYDFCFMPRDMVPENSGIETGLFNISNTTVFRFRLFQKGDGRQKELSRLFKARGKAAAAAFGINRADFVYGDHGSAQDISYLSRFPAFLRRPFVAVSRGFCRNGRHHTAQIARRFRFPRTDRLLSDRGRGHRYRLRDGVGKIKFKSRRVAL